MCEGHAMTVRVEFFGIPRERAGVTAIDVRATTLGTVCEALRVQLPPFAAACLDGNRLRPGYLANINGRVFASDPQTPLQPGDSVLILSADAGG